MLLAVFFFVSVFVVVGTFRWPARGQTPVKGVVMQVGRFDFGSEQTILNIEHAGVASEFCRQLAQLGAVAREPNRDALRSTEVASSRAGPAGRADVPQRSPKRRRRAWRLRECRPGRPR